MNKKRADQLTYDLGLAESIDMSKRIIVAGEVYHKQQRVVNPSQMLPADAELEIRRKRFVSRGGLKLESAVKHFGIEAAFAGAKVLDIGASTGGFTDYALQSDAAKVYAVDVGHGHLDWKLRNDQRVEVYEKTNIKVFSDFNFGPFDIVVGDISFNSIVRLLPSILPCSISESSKFLLLIKPQFELPAEMVRNGVVADTGLHQKAIELVENELVRSGCTLQGIVESGVKGRYGNQEYFCFFKLTDLACAEQYLKSVTKHKV